VHFAVAVQSAPPPTPRKAAGQSLGLALLLVSMGVVAVLCVWLLAVLRRGRRLRDQAGRGHRTRYTDAWAESGRRLEVPPTDDEGLREPDGGPR